MAANIKINNLKKGFLENIAISLIFYKLKNNKFKLSSSLIF